MVVGEGPQCWWEMVEHSALRQVLLSPCFPGQVTCPRLHRPRFKPGSPTPDPFPLITVLVCGPELSIMFSMEIFSLNSVIFCFKN